MEKEDWRRSSKIDAMIEPVRQPMRRILVAMKQKLKGELACLWKIRVIKPVNTPTDWLLNLVVVKKSNGKLRMCIDSMPLNKALKHSHHPLPVIGDLLPDLSKAKVFSICDVKNGFWHVELDEASTYLTTFSTPFGSNYHFRSPLCQNTSNTTRSSNWRPPTSMDGWRWHFTRGCQRSRQEYVNPPGKMQRKRGEA